MDALTLLLNRSSQPRLVAPAPQGEVLENIKAAALRAPDHASLKPWRFVICEGKGLLKLGSILEQSAIDNDKSVREVERAAQLPQRAPMVIIAIAQVKPHDKVPKIEQIVSASCAVMAMQQAAVAQGFQGIWRTGSYAYCDSVKRALGLAEIDEIVGFLYLGTAVTDSLARPKISTAEFFEHWC